MFSLRDPTTLILMVIKAPYYKEKSCRQQVATRIVVMFTIWDEWCKHHYL